jgi:tetratricopeptide (TPR) repeat protein
LGLTILSVAACGGAETRMAKHLQKGQSFLDAGNLEKARIEFQNALQISPKNAQARFEMGVVDEKLGRQRDAAQFYQGVIDVSPDHVEARTRLARLYLFSSAADRALDLIKPALEKHPDDAGLLTVRAAIRVQQKDLTGAQADAERAVQLAPTSEDAIAVLAGVYASQGNVAKAQALLEHSVQRIPGSIDLRSILAQTYAQQSRPADVEAQLLKIVELKPGEKLHRLRLAQFYAQSNQNDAAEHTLRQAIKDLPAERGLKLSLIDFLAARRSRESAETELRTMIAAAPDDYEMKFALAKFYQAGKEPAKATAVYTGVIDKEKLNPPGLTARDRLAALKLQDNDVAGALALTNEVLAKSPRDDDALFIRGTISLAKKDPRSAIADLRAVLRDQPEAVGVLRSLARAHLENGEPAVAEETMRHAVEANPKDGALKLDFAQLLAQLGKPDQAKPILVDLVKQQPENLDALDTLFRVGMATKDLPTAKSAADGIVALRPKAAVGYLYQGIVAESDKHTEEALRLYAMASEVQPDIEEPVQAEVHLLMASKRTDEAIKRYTEFSARYPTSPMGPDAIGEVLLATGKIADAQAAFRLAIARSPKWWMAYRDLAAAQLVAKDPDAAIETLKTGQAAADQAEKLGVQLASLFESQGKPDAAIAVYDGLLQRYPRSSEIANNLAMLLSTYKSDAKDLDRAKTLSAPFAESANPSLLDTYGWVLFKRGETAESVAVLERVVAKVPNEPVARYHLGMAQFQVGSSTEARDNLMRAVNSGIKFFGLDEAKSTLDKLAKLPTVAAAPKT